jgi:hypothetical protein
MNKNKFIQAKMEKAKKISIKKKKIGMSQRQLAYLSEDNKTKHDLDVTAEDCIKDLNRIQQLCPNEVVVRDFYRAHGNYHETTWTRYFGSWRGFVKRSGILETSSGEEKLKRLIAKIGETEIYIKYFKEQIVPYHGKYKKKDRKGRIKTILVISDIHDLEVDRFVLAIILDLAKRVQPDIILVNGDAYDFYELTTKFKHDPRLYRPIERMTFVREVLFGGLRKACPKSQIDFSFGNHEARLIKLLADEPQIRLLLGDLPWLNMSVKDLMGLDKYSINVISKLDLQAFSNDKPEQACKENYEIYYGCYVGCHEYDEKFKGMSGTHGHTHKPGVTFSKTLVGGVEKDTSWMTTGCVSKPRVEYEEGVTKYINAIGLAHIDTLTGDVQQELIHIPGDFGVVAGTYYFRSDFQHSYEKELTLL